GARDGRLEGREEHLPQGSLRDLGRADVRAALRLPMTRHVLECRKHMAWRESIVQGRLVTLEAFDGSHSELPDQIGILSVGLFDASPACIARYVDDGRERQLHAASTDFAGDDCEDASQELRIPGARERQRLRKMSRSASGIAVQPLFVKQRRYAEARLGDVVMLDSIDQIHRLSRVPERLLL